jgi:outer membrane protein
VNADRAFELAKVDLIQTLQLDPRGRYEFAPPTLDTTSKANATFSLDSLLTRALGRRSDLFAQQSLVSAASQNVKAAKGAAGPRCRCRPGTTRRSAARPSIGFTDQLNQRRGGSIAIGMSIPLFEPRHDGSCDTARADREDNARSS